MGEIKDLQGPLESAELDALKAAAPQFAQELQVYAAVFNVNWRQLAICLMRAVGPLKFARCLMSGGDFWTCLGTIDWEAVIACAGGALPTGEFDVVPEGATQGVEPEGEDFK